MEINTKFKKKNVNMYQLRPSYTFSQKSPLYILKRGKEEKQLTSIIPLNILRAYEGRFAHLPFGAWVIEHFISKSLQKLFSSWLLKWRGKEIPLVRTFLTVICQKNETRILKPSSWLSVLEKYANIFIYIIPFI